MLYISSGQSLLKVLPGQVLSIATDPNTSYQIVQDPNSTTAAPVAKAVRQGDNLIVSYADGTSIAMEDYFLNCIGDSACQLILNNQELATLLNSQATNTIEEHIVKPSAEFNIFMTNDPINYSTMLELSLRNNLLVNTTEDVNNNTGNSLNAIASILSENIEPYIINEQEEPPLVNNAPINSITGAVNVNEDTSLAFTGANSISVSDVDGNLDSTQLSVTQGILNVTLSGSATISAGNNGTNTLTISGSQSEINASLASLTYQGNLDYFGSDSLTILSTDSSGTPLTDSDTLTITINSVEDAPINTLPGAQSVNEDTSLAITGISVADAEGNLASTQLSVTQGILNVTLSGSATISSGTDGTNTLTISGSQSDINASLASLIYQGNLNYFGSDSLTILSTDSSGTPLTDSDTVAILINNVNDAPTLNTHLQQLSFDGSNDYLTLPNIPAANGFFEGGSYTGLTILASVTYDAFGDYYKVLSLSESGIFNDNITLGNNIGSNDLTFLIFRGASRDKIIVEDFYQLGVKTTIAITQDTTGDVSIYKDGVAINAADYVIRVNSNAPETTMPVNIWTPLSVDLNDNYIAKSHFGDAPFFGDIDDIALFNRALTNDEVLSAMQADYAALDADPSTIFHYSFDQTDFLLDQSAKDNHITSVTGNPLQESSEVSYIENSDGVVIAGYLSLEDIDSSTLASATVAITTGLVNAEDQLNFSNTVQISGSYDAVTGTLTLSNTGGATVTDFQDALRSVTYTNNSNNPDTTPRVISWSVNDGITDSATVTSTINITAVNDAPQVFSGQQQMAFDGNDDYLTIPTIVENQGLHDSGGNFLGMSIAASVTMDAFNHFNRIIDLSAGGANNHNIYISNKWATSTLRYEINDGTSNFAVDVQNFFTLGQNVDLVINHASNGVVTIYRNGIEIDPAVNAITINNSPAPDPIIILTPVNVTRNTNLIGKSHAGGTTFFEGSMDNISLVARTLSEAEITTLASGDYSALNQDSATIFNYAFDGSDPLTDQSGNGYDATAIGGPQTITDTVDFVIGGSEIIVGAEILLIDADNTHLSSATISINTGFDSTEDSLSFTDTAVISGIYNPSTGVMTLTGSATVEQYQDALRSVAYSNSNSVNPSTADRTISWSVNDGIDDSAVVNTLVELVPNQIPLVFSGQQQMSFDGIDDHLALPDIMANQGLHDSSGNFLGMSIAATVTIETLQNFGHILDLSKAGGVTDNIRLSNSAATTTLHYAVRVGGTAKTIKVADFFTENETINIVINHAIDGTVTIYKNGIAIDPSVITVTINSVVETGPLVIHTPDNITRDYNLIGNSSVGTHPFKGSMDNVAVLARTLSEAEITTLASGDYSDLNQDNATIFNYAFDGSDPLADQSINNNDAVAFGSPASISSFSSFAIGGMGTAIADKIMLADADNTMLVSASISIEAGFIANEDLLSFTNTANINGNYDASNGVLTLTGSASLTQYQAALRSVTYTNINSINPDTTDRNISWRINDGIDDSQPVTTTVQLLALPTEITLTANNTGSSVSGFSGSLEATLTDSFDYQPMNPISSSPNHHYQPTNVGFHSVEAPGDDAVLNYDLNTHYRQFSNNNSFVIDLYGRDNYFTTDDDFDILIFDSSGVLLGSIENLALPDTSTAHLRVNVSDLLAPPLLDGDTIGAFRIIAHDSTTSNPNNYFTLMEIRAADIINISTEITLTANNIGSSVSGFSGSMEATLTDNFDYQPLNPISASPDHEYKQTNVGFHSVEAPGNDAVLNYDLNTLYTQFSNNNALVIDLYGRDSYNTTDDDFDILIFDHNGTLLGSIENLALPDTAAPHLRVNVSALLSPTLADGDTVGAFRIIAHDSTTSNPNNYFTLMEIRAADLVNTSNAITLTANNTGSSVSGFSGSLEATLSDAFNYQVLNPASSAPNQTYSSNAGFHGDELDGVDVVLNYDLNTQYTQSANNNALVIDIYGRDTNLTRDNDFDIQVFDASDTLLGTIEHLAIPDNVQAHLRVNITQALSAEINDSDTIAKFRIIGHDSILNGLGNGFTILEVRAAELILATPIILDLDGDGIETTTLAAGVSFDIDGDGVKEHTAWVANDDALLVRDINGDGQINAANELFGSATRLNNGSNAKDGYAALADLDSNHDGVINAFDELFNELQTWQDRNSDAIVQEGELTYLKDSNIAELNLLASDTNEWQNDNLIGKQSQWTDSNGDSHQMADVWLNFTEQDDAALSQFSIELSSHSNSEELLFSQQISQTQTAPAFTSTNSSKLIHSVIENTPANVEVLDTSANDDALRNASIVL